MNLENPYSPEETKERLSIDGGIPYLYLTSILLLVFTALFWYLRDAHQLREAEGSLVLQTPPVLDSSYSVVEFQTPILAVVVAAGFILTLANGVLWLVRRRAGSRRT